MQTQIHTCRALFNSIIELCKQISPARPLQFFALQEIAFFSLCISRLLAISAAENGRITEKSSRNAIIRIFGGDLAAYCVSELEKDHSETQLVIHKESVVSIIAQHSTHCTEPAAMNIAIAVEYALAEILELASTTEDTECISTQNIASAIAADPEIDRLTTRFSVRTHSLALSSN
jgi:hypothetical protein